MGLRLADPELGLLGQELQDLLVVVRIIGGEGRDLPVRCDRLLLPAGRDRGVPAVAPQGSRLGGDPQGAVERGKCVFRLPASELEEPLDLEGVGVPRVELEAGLHRLPRGLRVREAVEAPRDLPVYRRGIHDTPTNPPATRFEISVCSANRPVGTVLCTPV